MFPRQTLQSFRPKYHKPRGRERLSRGGSPLSVPPLEKTASSRGRDRERGRRRVSISLHVKAACRRRIQKAATRQRIVGERCLKVTVDPAKREKILFPGAKVSQSVGCGGRGELDRLRLRLWLGLRRGDVNREKRKDFRV